MRGWAATSARACLGLEDMHGGAVYVLELSSYQLDLTSSLKADAAILLNITPDHLDRHGGMEGYVAAKRRVFQNQERGCTAVIGVDDAPCQRICTELLALNRRTIVPISAGRSMGRGVYALQGVLYDATGERAVEVADLVRGAGPARQAQLAERRRRLRRGRGARRLALGSQCGAGELWRAGAPHGRRWRLIDGVRFVNDSKATNADASRQAMSTIPRFFWIAGGRAKAGGIEPLRDLFGRVAHAYLIGEAADDFASTIGDSAPVTRAETMEHAVAAAFQDAARFHEDAVVLLSPACASFDQFSDFEARGDAFRAAVQALAAQRLRKTG